MRIHRTIFWTGIAMLVLILVAVPASAQTTVTPEEQFLVQSRVLTLQLDVDVEKTVSKTWTISAWGLKTADWGEFYIGLTKQITPWAALTLQAGMEQDKSPWRMAATLFLSGRNHEAFFLWEDGGSGKWYKLYVIKSAGPALGLFSQRYVGTGPMVQIPIGKKIKIWTVPFALQKGGQLSSLTGVKFIF